MAKNYVKPKIPTYAQGGENTDLNIARKVLYKDHLNASKEADKILGEVVKPTEYKKVSNKVNGVVNNLHSDTRATMMGSIEDKIGKTLQQQNEKLLKQGIPALTPVQAERIQNRIVGNRLDKFKGKTLDQRLRISKEKARRRLKNELKNSTTKKGAKTSRQKALNFLTDNREGARSLQGGSNYKYNERLLVSEFNRAKQDTMREVAKELGMLTKWTLSPNHNIEDICDIHAESTGNIANEIIEKYKLSIFKDGVYAGEEIPEYPHPYCQCDINPVDIDYGLIGIDKKQIFANSGEDMVPFNDAMLSEESQKYYQEWLKSEYKTVKPYDYTRRTRQEVERKMKFLDRKTTAGIEGTVELRNKPLEKYVRTGGSRAYEELSKNTIGKYLDEELVEKIGLDNSIKILAQDIKKSGKADDIIMAIDKYNAEELPKAMKNSLASARKYMNEADGYRLQVARGTPKRAVMGLRSKAIQNARQELGDAIGYADVHERLLKELKSGKDIDFLQIPYKNKKGMRSIIKTLDVDEKDIKTYTRRKVKYVAVGEKGIDNAKMFYEKTSPIPLSPRLDKIRAGKMNKKGWIPANFKSTFIDKSTGKEIPFNLRPDQQTGIRFIKENKVGMFHYKPGAGKTHTAMGSITELASEGKVKKSLVVVPRDLVRQFRDEIEEFTENVSVRAMTYQSPAKRAEEYLGDQLITIISQNQLASDADKLAKAGFDMVVVDEIHLLREKMFKGLDIIDANYRVGMTGTAIKDSIMDMYDALDWLSPVGMPPKYKLESKFSDITKASSFYQDSVLRDLRDTLKPLVITKDSPVQAKLVQKSVPVTLTKKQMGDIKEIELKAIARRDKGQAKSQVEAWRDRQLGKVVNSGNADDNAKFAKVQKIIEKHDKDKIIIFASDRDSMKTIQQGFGEQADYYTTKLTKAQRDKTIKNFRLNPDKKILVLSDAGATGLNLEVSNVAVHWDIPDQFYKLEQRMARNWRGMKTTTTYQYLLESKTSYDSRISQALAKSKRIAESAKVAETLDEQGVAKVLKELLRRKSK